MLNRKYNLWSFILCFFVVLLALQALYASSNGTWQWAPPVLILWLFTVILFIMEIVGFQDKSSGWARWRSWLTVLIALPLSILFMIGAAINIFAREPLETTQSPDSKIIIDFYTLNGGAAASISVTGVINGPLWFKKKIYYEDPMHEVDVNWTNNHSVTINNHTLDLKKGETFLY